MPRAYNVTLGNQPFLAVSPLGILTMDSILTKTFPTCEFIKVKTKPLKTEALLPSPKHAPTVTQNNVPVIFTMGGSILRVRGDEEVGEKPRQ